MLGDTDWAEIREVGPRDGLQGFAGERIGAARRIALVERLGAAGLSRIEVGSFVSPRAVPQMADTAEVVDGLSSGSSVEVLVVDERGATTAVRHPGDALLAVVAATDAFSLRNVRSDRAAALSSARAVASIALAAGRTPVANIAVAFGCPDEGPVPVATVADLAADLVDAGFEHVYLSDTIGVAGPREIEVTVRTVASAVDVGALGLHLHDTRGLGLVNALAGLEAGIRRFDASVGGIGGCPFAPGATGNVATEDLVHLLERVGIPTGVDLDALVATAHWLSDEYRIDLPGHVWRARRWRQAA